MFRHRFYSRNISLLNSQRDRLLKLDADCSIEFDSTINKRILEIENRKKEEMKEKGSSVIVCPPSAKGTQISTEADFRSEGPKCVVKMQKLARDHQLIM